MTDFDKLRAYILSACYTNMTLPTTIDYVVFCSEYLDDAPRENEVAHVFGWLEREGLVRCLDDDRRAFACQRAELTMKGHTLIQTNRWGAKMVDAFGRGSIELAASFLTKLLAGA
jgi:hypothetical protein